MPVVLTDRLMLDIILDLVVSAKNFYRFPSLVSWSCSLQTQISAFLYPSGWFLIICTEKNPLSEPQEIRNIHNDELMGIRREEEMEMSDEEIEDPSEMKETEESGKITFCSSYIKHMSLQWSLLLAPLRSDCLCAAEV